MYNNQPWGNWGLEGLSNLHKFMELVSREPRLDSRSVGLYGFAFTLVLRQFLPLFTPEWAKRSRQEYIELSPIWYNYMKGTWD